MAEINAIKYFNAVNTTLFTPSLLCLLPVHFRHRWRRRTRTVCSPVCARRCQCVCVCSHLTKLSRKLQQRAALMTLERKISKLKAKQEETLEPDSVWAAICPDWLRAAAKTHFCGHFWKWREAFIWTPPRKHSTNNLFQSHTWNN